MWFCHAVTLCPALFWCSPVGLICQQSTMGTANHKHTLLWQQNTFRRTTTNPWHSDINHSCWVYCTNTVACLIESPFHNQISTLIRANKIWWQHLWFQPYITRVAMYVDSTMPNDQPTPESNVFGQSSLLPRTIWITLEVQLTRAH